MSVFSYGGSLPHDSPLYVGRADKLEQLGRCVKSKRPKYALVFGAPLVGKTSLIQRLRHCLPENYQLHIIDVGHHEEEEDFYHYIADELIRRFRMQGTLYAAHVRNGSDFQKLLRDLHPPISTTFVIVFERLGYVQDKVLQGFSDILRNISEGRDEVGNEAFQAFCFLLTGGIELYKAVHDRANSPLVGVAEPVYIDDLSLLESNQLLSYGFGQEGLPEKTIAFLCKHIYNQVHGHPYLTQRLADELMQRITAGHGLSTVLITDTLTRLLNDDQRIDSMINKAQQEGLHETLYEIALKKKEHPWHGSWKTKTLDFIGFIREEKGKCVIRNLAYKRKLEEMFSIVPSARPDAPVPARPTLLESRVQSEAMFCTLQLTQQPAQSSNSSSQQVSLADAAPPASLMPWQRHNLEQKRDETRRLWDLRNKKVQRIKQSLAIENDATTITKYEAQLALEEPVLASLTRELEDIERALQ